MIEQLFGLILTLSFSSAYIPQIIKIIKHKRSNDISLSMLVINAMGYGSGLVYVLLQTDKAFWLMFNYSAGLAMTIICTTFWLIHHK